jgi:hypothetical protein
MPGLTRYPYLDFMVEQKEQNGFRVKPGMTARAKWIPGQARNDEINTMDSGSGPE